MTMFADWYLDPETTLELAAIRKLTGCTTVEAIAMLQRQQANERLEALEYAEWAQIEDGTEEGEE